jgi:GT2 family glycosyltransferase
MYVYELGRELVRRGHQVTVAAHRVEGALEPHYRAAGIAAYRFDAFPMGQTFDIVHANEGHPTRWALNRFPDTPILVTVHSRFDCEQPERSYRVFHYVCVRPEVQEKITRVDWIQREKTSVVYNPVDLSRFSPCAKTEHSRNPRVLFCGTVDQLRKAAILNLITRSRIEKFDLRVVGMKPESYDGYLEVLPTNVQWFDQTWNVEEHVSWCDETAGVLLGRTTIEGWAAKKPGWIYDVDASGDIKSYEIYQPPSDMDRFDAHHVTDQIEALYQGALEESKPVLLTPPQKQSVISDRTARYDIVMANYITPGTRDVVIDCLKSIRACSTNYRLIFVDNGSPDFHSVESELDLHENVLVIKNRVNLGFVKATNQGMRLAAAPRVVLLNNDTVVVPNWLERMDAALVGSVGIVGPRSNPNGTASGELIWRSAHIMSRPSMLIFFCVMIDRKVMETIGILDEDFGVGLGDDDNYCYRAQAVGFDLCFLGDLTIYHRHRTTFSQMYTSEEIKDLTANAYAMLRRKGTLRT